MPDDSDVSGEAGSPRGRDFWDKAKAIAGLTTAVLVALIGGLFTYVYNQRRLSAQHPWHRASSPTGQAVRFDGTSSSCSQQPFCGDFETGDLTQWSSTPSQGVSSWTAVMSPVAQGTIAGQFTTGPSTVTSRFEAAITADRSGALPGQDWYYGWWTRFPSVNGEPQSWWNHGGDWNVFAQFNERNGSRWIGMGVDDTRIHTPYTNIFLGTYTGNHHIIQLQYDQWIHFVIHIRWATDATGLVELWKDGTSVWTETNPTLPADNPQGLLSIGYYTGAWPATNTVIHDGFCRAATYTDAAAC